MTDTDDRRRSDGKPTLGEAMCIMGMKAEAQKIASALGVSALTVLTWTRESELRPIRQDAGKRGAGRPSADWSARTGMSDPADLLVAIEILDRLGARKSRRSLFLMVAKHAPGEASMKARTKRAAALKDLHRRPPADIQAAADVRIAGLPAGSDGLRAALAEIHDRIWPDEDPLILAE